MTTAKTSTPATHQVTGGQDENHLTLSVAQSALVMQLQGLSVLPVLPGKKPAIAWKQYQQTPAPLDQVQAWFTNPQNIGVGVITGAVSGNLEMLEIEGTGTGTNDGGPTSVIPLADIQKRFTARGAGELFTRVFVSEKVWSEYSPKGGLHFYYRVQGAPVLGNTKLACNTNGEVVIETRGEGGYSVVAPTPKEAHNQPNNVKNGWELTCESPTPWTHIPTVNAEEYQLIHEIMRTFNQKPKTEKQVASATAITLSKTLEVKSSDNWGVRPGDEFENRVTWSDILTPHGWQFHSVKGSETLWTRPGKHPRDGHSASTGYAGDRDRLYVWSSSTCFTPETPITKFHAYSVLNHNGDHAETTKALHAQGYGIAVPRIELDLEPTYTLNKTRENNKQETTANKSETTGKHQDRKTTITMMKLSEIRKESVKYFWQDRIPLNTVCIFGGKGGCGKSTFLAYLMSKASTGQLEGAHKNTPIKIGLYSLEDNAGAITVPRYEVNGANLNNILVFTLDNDPNDMPALKVPTHINLLETVIREHNLKALALDPITRTQTGKQDKAQDVQELISELVQLATRTECTIIGVHHTKKGQGVAEEALSGSHQWRDSARGVILFAQEPDTGNSVYQVDKLNGGLADQKPYAFKISPAEYSDDEGNISLSGRVEEQGISAVSVEALLNRTPASGAEEEKRADLEAFLRDALKDGEPHTLKELKEGAKELGITTDKKAWSRCASRLHIIREGAGTAWTYQLIQTPELT